MKTSFSKVIEVAVALAIFISTVWFLFFSARRKGVRGPPPSIPLPAPPVDHVHSSVMHSFSVELKAISGKQVHTSTNKFVAPFAAPSYASPLPPSATSSTAATTAIATAAAAARPASSSLDRRELTLAEVVSSEAAYVTQLAALIEHFWSPLEREAQKDSAGDHALLSQVFSPVEMSHKAFVIV